MFYTGREAWKRHTDVYLLGLNPGGDPIAMRQNTIASHTNFVLAQKRPWSEYRDSDWNNRPPGTFGMQPRVLHLLKALNRDPTLTPASNLVFTRTRSERDIVNKKYLIDSCWRFHDAVIRDLQIRTVVCFGKTVGTVVRRRLGANELINTFTEKNDRQWCSRLYRGNGIYVAMLTHPSRVDWSNCNADPSPLVASTFH